MLNICQQGRTFREGHWGKLDWEDIEGRKLGKDNEGKKGSWERTLREGSLVRTLKKKSKLEKDIEGRWSKLKVGKQYCKEEESCKENKVYCTTV